MKPKLISIFPIEKLNNINLIFEGYSVMPVLSMACFAGGERG